MRLFVCGSAPLPAHTLEEFRAKYGHTILERYGMSETLMNLSNPYYGERRPGSVGTPLPGMSAKILNEQGEPAKDGETGELYWKGPNLFAGYWRREKSYSRGLRRRMVPHRRPRYALTRRLLHAMRTPQRSDHLRRLNIYPREIEEFLEEQEGVHEAAVAAAIRSGPRRGPGSLHRRRRRIRRSSNRSAARSSPRSKFHESSIESTSSPAMHSAKCRNTSSFAP